jgi:hypothetical protein
MCTDLKDNLFVILGQLVPTPSLLKSYLCTSLFQYFIKLMNCNTKLVTLRCKVDMHFFDMIQYEFLMQKITNYAAIALLMWMSHASADDTVAGLAKIQKLQKESAIPSWQAATQ